MKNGSSQNTAINQIVRIFRKHDFDYNQSKYIFKEVREKLHLKAKPAGSGSVKRLWPSEREKFMQSAAELGAKEFLMMTTIYEAGLRVGEFVALDVSDFSWKERRIKVRRGKGAKRREIPLSENYSKLLWQYCTDRTGPIFLSRLKRRYSERSVLNLCKQIGEAAEISEEVNTHRLRHTRACDLAEAGLSEKQIARFLGHKNTRTTEVYTRTADVNLTSDFRKLIG